jgi:uncharacterized protein (TIGR03086 family)
MIDLRPASDRMIALVTNLTDDDLRRPTPCGDASVGDLIDHLGMFASNFAKVAAKQLDATTSTPPRAFDAANLSTSWRGDVVRALDALATAWSSADAWTGTTWVGGMHLPADVVGVIAVDELVVHGWDLSRATGQSFAPAAHEVDAAIGFISHFEAPRDGRLFGPVVEVGADASDLDRLLGLAGRDPNWHPPD